MNPTRVTVKEFLERWLAEYAWPNLAPRTAEGYEHIIRRRLIPALGPAPLSQLHPEDLQGYYAKKLAAGRLDGNGALSPRTVWRHRITPHDALRSAVKRGLIGRNPADAVDPHRFQHPEMRTLDNDGVRAFLEAARSTPYYALFYLALFTGMRRSELLALQWADVNLDLAQMSISRTLHMAVPSSDSPRRPRVAAWWHSPQSAALLLREHRDSQEVIRCIMGTALEGENLVFSQPDGKPLLPDTVTRAWVKLVRRASLRGIRLHDARRTDATLMLEAGIHPRSYRNASDTPPSSPRWTPTAMSAPISRRLRPSASTKGWLPGPSPSPSLSVPGKRRYQTVSKTEKKKPPGSPGG